MERLFLRRMVLVLIILTFLSCEGCEAFRKKFVRKKQMEEETMEQVILEPQEYPEVVHDNPELYKNSYTLCKAWYSDLLESLKDEGSYKKQLQCFNEVLKNLSEMRNLLKEEKQQELDLCISEISNNKEQLINSRLKNSILPQLKSNLARVEKTIRTKFNYNKIKESIR